MAIDNNSQAELPQQQQEGEERSHRVNVKLTGEQLIALTRIQISMWQQAETPQMPSYTEVIGALITSYDKALSAE